MVTQDDKEFVNFLMESMNMNFQRNKSDSFPEEVIKKYKENIMYDPVMVIDLNTLVLRPSKYSLISLTLPEL